MTDVPYIKPANDGVLLLVHVQPGAKKTEISGVHGDRIKVRISAARTDGKANKELISFVSKLFSIPKRNVEITKGERMRDKSILLLDVSAEEVLSVIGKQTG